MVSTLNPVRIGPDVLMASAVVRLDVKDGQPHVYLHEDNAHACVGVSSAEIIDDYVRINTCKPGPVMTAFAFPDETISAKKGVIMGISGGGPGSNVWFYSTKLNRRLLISDINDYLLVASTYSNIWFEIKWYVPESI